MGPVVEARELSTVLPKNSRPPVPRVSEHSPWAHIRYCCSTVSHMWSKRPLCPCRNSCTEHIATPVPCSLLLRHFGPELAGHSRCDVFLEPRRPARCDLLRRPHRPENCAEGYALLFASSFVSCVPHSPRPPCSLLQRNKNQKRKRAPENPFNIKGNPKPNHLQHTRAKPGQCAAGSCGAESRARKSGHAWGQPAV